MLSFFVSISIAIFVYVLIRLIFDRSGEEIEKRRVANLIPINEFHGIEEIIKEKKKRSSLKKA